MVKKHPGAGLRNLSAYGTSLLESLVGERGIGWGEKWGVKFEFLKWHYLSRTLRTHFWVKFKLCKRA